MFVAVCEEKNQKLEESERKRRVVEEELGESERKREAAEGRVEELVLVCEKDRLVFSLFLSFFLSFFFSFFLPFSFFSHIFIF